MTISITVADIATLTDKDLEVLKMIKEAYSTETAPTPKPVKKRKATTVVEESPVMVSPDTFIDWTRDTSEAVPFTPTPVPTQSPIGLEAWGRENVVPIIAQGSFIGYSQPVDLIPTYDDVVRIVLENIREKKISFEAVTAIFESVGVMSLKDLEGKLHLYQPVYNAVKGALEND